MSVNNRKPVKTKRRVPPTERAGVYEGDFESARRKAREKEYTGVLSVEDAFAVFLDGIVVYVRGANTIGKETLSEIGSCENVTIWASAKDQVEMFLTYVGYIGDEAVLEAEPVDGPVIGETEIENILLDGVRTRSAGSWRGETYDTDKSFLPDGKVVAFATDYESLRKYASENEVSGYATRTDDIVTFVDGEFVGRRRTEIPDHLVRCPRWTLVEPRSTNPEESSEESKSSDGEEGGFWSGLLG